jgi:hypothetical protein
MSSTKDIADKLKVEHEAGEHIKFLDVFCADCRPSYAAILKEASNEQYAR